MKKLEKLSETKFDALKDSKISKLTSVVGGQGVQTWSDSKGIDYTYGGSFDKVTYKSAGDTVDSMA